ncbi:MAG: GNAT family N-acetyltransferase [Caulobacteraceae bacterium]
MELRPFQSVDLTDILALCEALGWLSLPADPERARRALTAPGVTTLVARQGGALAGFCQLQSDGEIQAHLSLIAVDPAFRGRGLGRELIREALKLAGGLRIDLLTDAAEAFYRALPSIGMAGFRLYPFYTGPDRDRSNVRWEDGRKVKDQ